MTMTRMFSDDRTAEEKATHRWLVVMTDSFMSGWGEARGGLSVCAWACKDEREAATVEHWVRSRRDARRVRTVIDGPRRRYRPRNAAHFHIYVPREGHPALTA